MAGEISTHVISKLGLLSVGRAAVKLFYNADLNAGCRDDGWQLICATALSDNGGHDTLVPPGELRVGLYLIEFDFSGVDEAARQIFKRTADGEYTPLHPTGFFLACKCAATLKIENTSTNNHLVVSVGEKEITIRPGVRAH